MDQKLLVHGQRVLVWLVQQVQQGKMQLLMVVETVVGIQVIIACLLGLATQCITLQLSL